MTTYPRDDISKPLPFLVRRGRWKLQEAENVEGWTKLGKKPKDQFVM
jgi:Cys-tRNA synthase (O-phospho-L-seryl-tRNA:Cys-tRNA synthase)